jgi:hypothetical protein
MTLTLEAKGLGVVHDMPCQVISKSLNEWLSYGLDKKCDRLTELISISPIFLLKGRGQTDLIRFGPKPQLLPSKMALLPKN